MIKSKLIFVFISLISLIAISTTANAFRIENGTKKSLSFAINNTCSNEFGTIKPHDYNIISQEKFFTVCMHNRHNCIVKIYTKDACSGKHTATMVLDIDWGYKTATKAGPYMYTARLYDLLITERED